MYSYYRSITIDHTLCGSANSTDFPVLITGTYTYLKTTGNGGNVTSSSGYDIAFYSDSGLTTQLKHETVSWNGSTGAVEYWVKVPTLSSSSDTVIYLAYGDSGVTTDQSDKVNTWNTNFASVWHMNQDPTGSAPQLLDSTTNANHMTTENMASGDLVTGKIGNAIYYDGTNNASYNTAMSFSTWTTLSISFWVKGTAGSNGSGGSDSWRILDKGLGEIVIGWDRPTANRIYVYSNGDVGETSIDVADGTWHLVHFTSDKTNFNLYVDGTNRMSATGALSGTTDDIYVGKYTAGGYYGLFYLDELRMLRNYTFTSSWMTAEYNNQSNPSSFYTIGSATGAPDTPTNSTPTNGATSQNRNTTLTASAFSGNGTTHSQSQWLVGTDSGVSTLVWDSGATSGNLTSVIVNTTNGTFSGVLSGKTRLSFSTTYYWKVRYKDNNGSWSSYSSPTSFSTTGPDVTDNAAWVNHLAKYPIKVAKKSMMSTVESTPTDSASDGTIRIDTLNNTLWYRSNGAWYAVSRLRQIVATKSANYTLTNVDQVVVFTATATATLPAATGTGQTYRIVCRAGTTTIDGNSTDTIKGNLTQTLAAGEDLIITDTASGVWE